jgi:hypothetical protein
MGQNDQGMPPPTSFTAVANPHSTNSPLGAERRSRKSPGQDPYFATKSPDIDCLVVAGESHVFNDEDTALWREHFEDRVRSMLLFYTTCHSRCIRFKNKGR